MDIDLYISVVNMSCYLSALKPAPGILWSQPRLTDCTVFNLT